MEKWLPVGRVAANILNKQLRTADKGWFSSLGMLAEMITNPNCKNLPCYGTDSCASGIDLSFSRGQLKCDDTRAETRFRLSAKRTSPFKSAGASVQSTTGS